MSEPTENVSSVCVARNIPAQTTATLIACTAGRCEFRGCNQFLYENSLTGTSGTFAEKAHIVAFKENGPRGNEGTRPEEINGIDNLMLLCARCHKEIDDNPSRYPRSLLEQHKREHEDRIRHVCGLGPEMRTCVLQLKARIGTDVIDVSRSEIVDAVSPHYPTPDTHVIDLTALGDEKAGTFYDFAAARICEEAEKIYKTGSILHDIKHLSVFGLAPIPLLVVLGNCLSNKVQTSFFQCHRDQPSRWKWKEGTPHARFVTKTIQHGKSPRNVAVILSLSGQITSDTLPATLDGTFSIYEITLEERQANVGFLQQKSDLEGFRAEYRKLLSLIRKDHSAASEIHFFPAVPAPVAIACGYDLLPKIDPTLVIYDNSRKEGGFVERLRVSKNER